MAEPVIVEPGAGPVRGSSEALPAAAYGRRLEPDHDIRCWKCHAKLAEFAGRPWSFRCRKCKALTQSPGAEAHRVAPDGPGRLEEPPTSP